MPLIGVIGEIVEVRRSDGELCIEWRIPRFLSLSNGYKDYCQSPRFSFWEGSWFMQVWPYANFWEWVSLYLRRDDLLDSTKTVNVTVGVKGSGGVELKRERDLKISSSSYGSGFNKICKRSDLSERKHTLMPEDALVISCELRIPGTARDASSQTDEIFSEAEVLIEDNKSVENLGIEKLSEDMGRLLDCDENSDVTVQVGDAKFRVHRAILSVRSPVLSEMFKPKTAERASNKVTIKDCEPGVFRDFLQYLYTGSVPSLTEKNVFGLYRVADKYRADDLKSHCLKHIRNSLRVQTFCDTMKLALTHEESDLLEKAIDFAKENIQAIIISVEWQNFICEYPKEANEILIKSIGPRG